MENILKKIIEKIDKGEEISPFLFIDKNTEILNENIKNLALDILKYYKIPKEFLYIFEQNWKTIKVSEIRDFLTEKLYLSSPFKIQIFFIKNIWTFTDKSSNALLQFFEEPWKQNLIFLTNDSESFVLETILSRIQIVNFSWKSKSKRSEFFQDLIKKYLNNDSFEIISYFFKNKIDKEEYIIFLENLIIYAKENLVFFDFLKEILEDLNKIEKNNVNAKFIVDKWILKI